MSRESTFQSINANGRNGLQFKLSPTHVSYANTLVRLMITGVDMVGFRADIGEDGLTTDVSIEANTTPMTNEMLAHRIGLLPVHITDPTAYNKNEYEFHLDVVNDSDEVMDVKASDINVLKIEADSKIPVPTKNFFKPDPVTGDSCLIATLKPKHATGKAEEIRFKARASVGNGRENARFIPTSQCTYTYTLDDDEAHIKEVRDEWLNVQKKIPADSWETLPEERRSSLAREFETLGRKRCYLKNELGEPYSFDFKIESTGVLSPRYIIKKACEAGVAMCERYADESVTLSEDVLVQPTNKKLIGYDFVFQRQDHTLGNLLQTWIDQNYIDNGEVSFAGYMVPHPLRDEMILTIGVNDGQESTARRVLKEAARSCAAMFRTWADMWTDDKPVTSVPTAAQMPSVKKKRPIVRAP